MVVILSQVGWQPGRFAGHIQERHGETGQGLIEINWLDLDLRALGKRSGFALENDNPAANFAHVDFCHWNFLRLDTLHLSCAPEARPVTSV